RGKNTPRRQRQWQSKGEPLQTFKVEKAGAAVVPQPPLSPGAIFILIILAARGAVDLPFCQFFLRRRRPGKPGRWAGSKLLAPASLSKVKRPGMTAVSLIKTERILEDNGVPLVN